MNDSLIYRTASVNDKIQLKELALISYGQFAGVLSPANWEIMKGNINNDDNFNFLLNRATIFVCEKNCQIIGVAYFIPSGNPTAIFENEWSYIRMVGVHPQYRGLGIAKTLTQMCLDRAKKTNEKTIALHTSEFMDAARHIYESAGFVVLKEIGQLYGRQYWIYTLDVNKL